MISEKKKKPKTLAIMLVLALAVLFAFQMNPVLADVPDVTSIEWHTSGIDTFLNITVEHASPDSTHYVDLVTVSITEADAGTIYDDVTLGPQSTETFFVEYNLGEVTEYDTYTIQAKATCTSHGEGSWSGAVVIPEFSTLSLLLIFAIVSIAAFLFRSKARARANCANTASYPAR
ncbi:MAG: PEF-CTERM sorting domain-containing protein [Candidatus Bathyarchaeota archaeon]|nr:PEF-CTERM sorting domain-containing protein [Candidatus Bathyarchaeota archaeon]MCZ2807727.1 PEF-CTERM sorting domain-containing protein [Candidatus Bathyarchaeota archaeon]